MKTPVAGILFLILFGGSLVWFTWMVDVRAVQILLHQHNSESFPRVQGVVFSSEVTTTTTSKGYVHYHPYITYRYTVDGADYRGYHYRYDGHPADENSVNAIVSAHPNRSSVDVYYNPQNPNDSVLSTAVDAVDVGSVFLFSTINFFLLWVFVKFFQTTDWGRTRVAGGVKLITELMVTRVRLPRYQPVSVGLLAAGGLSVVAGFLISTSILHPPWDAGEWSLAGVLLGGAAMFAWHYQKICSGNQDLVIDEAGRTIRLPLTYKRREQAPVPFSQIRSVLLNKVQHSSKGGSYYTYMVTLELRDNSQEKLIDLNQKRAEAFAAWLKGKLGLSTPTTVLSPET